MKKFSLFALAAAGLLLGACSSEKDEIAAGPENLYGMVEGESSWLAVGISMPGDPITRANEDLTDGLGTEYAVKSGTLYLFKGANEDDAVFFQLFPITAEFSNEAKDNVPAGNSLGTNPTGFGEITSTSAKMVQEIQNPNLGINDKLYAYVILNDDKNATGITATAGTTKGSDFKKLQLKAIGIADESKGFGAIGDNGLVMTSVPIATIAGGESSPANANILTFTEIDKNAIYKTKAEAEAAGAQAACIYVERAAVKVEVQVAADFGIQLDGQGTPTGVAAEDVKWALGNVNHGGEGGVGYYNTRQIDKAWLPYNNLKANPFYVQWRMVGRTPFFNADHTPNPAYRTYFGYDPNYSGTGTIPQNANTGLINYQLTDGDNSQYTLAPNDVTYTYENTFDENCQIFRNTTYGGVKVKLSDGDFYTIEGQPNTMLASNADITAVVKTRLRDEINQRIAAINALIKTDLGKTAEGGRTFSAGVTTVTYDVDVAVTTGTYNAATGELPYTVTLSLKNVKTNGENASAADVAALNTLAAPHIGVLASDKMPANSKVYQYKGGISYYSVRIKHFGDVETPWNGPAEAYNVYQAAAPTPSIYPANATQTIDGVTTVYGDNYASAWLGRWGVVRNNWYVVKLNKIEGIGSPVPEDFSGEAGNTPDDNPPTSYFISAEVHILPWVKRFQEETL